MSILNGYCRHFLADPRRSRNGCLSNWCGWARSSEDLNKSPLDVTLDHELGVVHLGNGQKKQALCRFRRALKLDSAFTPTLKALTAHEGEKAGAIPQKNRCAGAAHPGLIFIFFP